MEISQKAVQSVPIYRAGNVSRQWVETGTTDGWYPVFPLVQNSTTSPDDDQNVFASLPTEGLIDLAGADAVALSVLGVPGGTNIYGLAISAIYPIKPTAADPPIAYTDQNVYWRQADTILPAGGKGLPGTLAGYFGITSAHRFAMANALTATGGTTSWVSNPNAALDTRKGMLHVFTFGAPFLQIRLWNPSGGGATNLQALYRPLCINETRGSALGV